MNLEDFIQKLETYPEDDEFKLYCHETKQYYYISNTDIIGKGTIYLTSTISYRYEIMKTYGDVIDRIKSYHNNMLKHRIQHDLIFIHDGQKFIIP